MSQWLSRILVADPDEIVVALLSHILHRQGYAVDVALTEEQAQLLLAQTCYGVVIADSKLISVVRPCEDRMARTILLSPEATSDLPVRSVVQKPVEFGLLLDTVRKIIE